MSVKRGLRYVRVVTRNTEKCQCTIPRFHQQKQKISRSCYRYACITDRWKLLWSLIIIRQSDDHTVPSAASCLFTSQSDQQYQNPSQLWQIEANRNLIRLTTKWSFSVSWSWTCYKNIHLLRLLRTTRSLTQRLRPRLASLWNLRTVSISYHRVKAD